MKKYLLAACVAVMGSGVMAQEPTCFESDGGRKIMLQSGMKMVFIGMMESGTQIIELWVKPNGEWITLATGANGASCMLLNGAEHSLPTLKPNA